MKQKKIKWHKVADSLDAIDWQKNDMAIVDIGGRKITLVKQENAIYACAQKCPHASGMLSDGFIDSAGYIVCPIHRYRFDLTNGRNVTGEGYFLKTYSIEEREAGVFIGFEENTWLDIFK